MLRAVRAPSQFAPVPRLRENSGGPPPLFPASRQLRPMLIKAAIVALLLVIVSVCLFGYVLNFQSGIFREFQAAVLSVEWMLLACMAVWCGTFLFLTFSQNDWPLISLLLITIAAYFISYTESWRAAEAIILLAGVTMGKSAFVLLRCDEGGNNSEIQKFGVRNFLVGLVVLLAFSAWWHLDIGVYHVSRWMGLWDNPNVYGMLMGAGLTLAIGLLAASLKSKAQSPKLAEENSDSSSRSFLRSLRSFEAENIVGDSWNSSLRIILFIAAGMMAVGLLFSYSRGAWVGTAVGLLYLAWCYGKLKWRWVLPGVLVAAAVVCFFWHSTSDNGPWYLKRLDLSRPSVQHRVSAWRGAVQMMRDHPLGVGWNQAVGVYKKNYSSPEGGAAAITTNDYLMLGTQLGLPGLICFVAYVGLCFRVRRSAVVPTAGCGGVSPSVATPGGTPGEPAGETPALRCACRAGALVLLVAFWFDGGLFKLATASVFWILLELGTSNLASNKSGKQPTPP